jgi:UDPglucose 6-dehydrogenase
MARAHPAADFVVVSNPEFLKEGTAVEDFMHPDRVVVGTDDPRARELLRQLYKPFFGTNERIVTMDARSAEITKYACNAYLATRVSFINDIANLCDLVGADVGAVRQGMGIRPPHRQQVPLPRRGLWRLVLPQGHAGLINTAREHGLSMSLVAAAERIRAARTPSRRARPPRSRRRSSSASRGSRGPPSTAGRCGTC